MQQGQGQVQGQESSSETTSTRSNEHRWIDIVISGKGGGLNAGRQAVLEAGRVGAAPVQSKGSCMALTPGGEEPTPGPRGPARSPLSTSSLSPHTKETQVFHLK